MAKLPYGFSLFLVLVFSFMFVQAYSADYPKVDPNVRVELADHNSTLVFITLRKGFQAHDLGIPFIREYSFGAVAATITLNELTSLYETPFVASIESNKKFSLFLQDAIHITNASKVHAFQVSGMNVTGIEESVCVIDTGVDFTHPDLVHANVIGGTVDCVSNSSDGQCFINESSFDTIGHGTHVAGIVAASGNIVGMAPSTGIASVKVFFDHTEDTSMFILINGLDWCINHSSDYNISVISMSLGTWPYENQTLCIETFPALYEAVLAAVAKNISVVSATGNDEYPVGTAAPACLPGVIPVGSSDKDDIISSFSNYAPWVKLFAPGGSINSTFPVIGADLSYVCSANTSYCILSGTSMATPMVSGSIAALNGFLHRNHRVLSPADLEDLLYLAGVPIYEDIWGEQYGYNFTRIHLLNALMALDMDSPHVSITFLGSTATNNSFNDTDEQNSTSFKYEFLCNSSDWQLTTLSFTIFNVSGSTIFEGSKNFSARTEEGFTIEVFSYNPEESFVALCNASDARNHTSSESLFVDNDFPSIEILSPLNDSLFVSSSQPVAFVINVTDFSLTSCFLLMSSLELPFLNDGSEKTTSYDFVPGVYSWNVTCFDSHNHTSSIDDLRFSVTAPDSSQGSSGGKGGGGGSSRKKTNSSITPSFNPLSDTSSIQVPNNLSTSLSYSTNTSNEPEPRSVTHPPFLLITLALIFLLICFLFISKFLGRFL
ncbi:MAG: S8 family serine peptidase [Nanoarchaeota archaeon]